MHGGVGGATPQGVPLSRSIAPVQHESPLSIGGMTCDEALGPTPCELSNACARTITFSFGKTRCTSVRSALWEALCARHLGLELRILEFSHAHPRIFALDISTSQFSRLRRYVMPLCNRRNRTKMRGETKSPRSLNLNPQITPRRDAFFQFPPVTACKDRPADRMSSNLLRRTPRDE